MAITNYIIYIAIVSIFVGIFGAVYLYICKLQAREEIERQSALAARPNVIRCSSTPVYSKGPIVDFSKTVQVCNIIYYTFVEVNSTFNLDLRQ